MGKSFVISCWFMYAALLRYPNPNLQSRATTLERIYQRPTHQQIPAESRAYHHNHDIFFFRINIIILHNDG